MSRQAKLRAKAQARKTAKTSTHKGPSGASGNPASQMAPNWVKDGSRKPKAALDKEAKRREERSAAVREAQKVKLIARAQEITRQEREVSNDS